MTDLDYMQLALLEAEKSYESGNYPCGAVLVVNDEIIGKAHNLKETQSDRISHAEMLLYIEYSSLLKQNKKDGATITMYTTLEPCLMCFGAACMHRVDRIVVSSPDPYGNMSKIQDADLGSFYTQLPKLEYGLCIEETYGLTKKFLEQKGDDESLRLLVLLSEIKEKLKVQ